MDEKETYQPQQEYSNLQPDVYYEFFGVSSQQQQPSQPQQAYPQYTLYPQQGYQQGYNTHIPQNIYSSHHDPHNYPSSDYYYDSSRPSSSSSSSSYPYDNTSGSASQEFNYYYQQQQPLPPPPQTYGAPSDMSLQQPPHPMEMFSDRKPLGSGKGPVSKLKHGMLRYILEKAERSR